MKTKLQKNISKIFCACVTLTSCLQAQEQQTQLPEYKRIVAITTSYNNKNWYKKNLDSFANQDYPNKAMIYVDDCSTDGTGNLVEQYIKENKLENIITLIKNKTRLGSSLANHYTAIHTCKDDDIAVILDGDDWLARNWVFSYINNIYQNPNVWLTYGQFMYASNNQKGFCLPMPEDIVAKNAFRSCPYCPSHLRTFYAGLFKRIKFEDFTVDGSFFSMAGDIAMMVPMLEMSGPHFKFVPEILLVYNDLNPLNDHKVSRELQKITELFLRTKPKYNQVSSPFATWIGN